MPRGLCRIGTLFALVHVSFLVFAFKMQNRLSNVPYDSTTGRFWLHNSNGYLNPNVTDGSGLSYDSEVKASTWMEIINHAQGNKALQSNDTYCFHGVTRNTNWVSNYWPSEWGSNCGDPYLWRLEFDGAVANGMEVRIYSKNLGGYWCNDAIAPGTGVHGAKLRCDRNNAMLWHLGWSLAGYSASPTNPSAVGDPHLTNLRGEKFDIHDGMHRLVHFPRGAPEDEALLMVDVKAVDMGHDSDCYSVYLQNVKLSGKWVGEEVIVGADLKNSSAPTLSPSAFGISFADMRMDWPTLAKQHDVPLTLKGSMPVTVTTGMREASGQDALGGEEMIFKIGDERAVSVQVWSSRGKNQLTHNKEVRYLNVEVQNLPENSGGIIGLDSYSRPSTSRCDLIQEERDLSNYIKADSADMSLLRLSISRPRWTASASPQ